MVKCLCEDDEATFAAQFDDFNNPTSVRLVFGDGEAAREITAAVYVDPELGPNIFRADAKSDEGDFTVVFFSDKFICSVAPANSMEIPKFLSCIKGGIDVS